AVVEMTPLPLAEEDSAVRTSCLMARARAAKGNPVLTERLELLLLPELESTGSYMDMRRRAAFAALLELGVYPRIATAFANQGTSDWTHWAAAGLVDTTLSCLHLLLELDGADVTDRRVLPFRIVEALDVIEDIRLGFVARAIGLACSALGLQRGEEALHRGVVPDIAGAANAAGDAELAQQPLELLAAVLLGLKESSQRWLAKWKIAVRRVLQQVSSIRGFFLAGGLELPPPRRVRVRSIDSRRFLLGSTAATSRWYFRSCHAAKGSADHRSRQPRRYRCAAVRVVPFPLPDPKSRICEAAQAAS